MNDRSNLSESSRPDNTLAPTVPKDSPHLRLTHKMSRDVKDVKSVPKVLICGLIRQVSKAKVAPGCTEAPAHLQIPQHRPQTFAGTAKVLHNIQLRLPPSPRQRQPHPLRLNPFFSFNQQLPFESPGCVGATLPQKSNVWLKLRMPQLYACVAQMTQSTMGTNLSRHST